MAMSYVKWAKEYGYDLNGNYKVDKTCAVVDEDVVDIEDDFNLFRTEYSEEYSSLQFEAEFPPYMPHLLMYTEPKDYELVSQGRYNKIILAMEEFTNPVPEVVEPKKVPLTRDRMDDYIKQLCSKYKT